MELVLRQLITEFADNGAAWNLVWLYVLVTRKTKGQLIITLEMNATKTDLKCSRLSRTDLQLCQEDIYDAKGTIQTTAIYGPMQMFGQHKFPGTVIIKRPLDELQILIAIQKLTVNLPISDDKFDLKTPETAVIQKLD